MEDPLQPEKTAQFAGIPATGSRGIHPASNGNDPGDGVLMDQQAELWICRAMDKSKQICPQHLDNSGELSTYQQHDDDGILQEGGQFFTNIEGGTHIGGRSLSKRDHFLWRGCPVP